jgi:hypothetical protein
MNQEQSPITKEFKICNAREFESVPPLFGHSTRAESRRRAMKEFSEKHTDHSTKQCQTVCQAKGDGVFAVDLAGDHWCPNTNEPDESKFEMRIALMDGETARVTEPFLWRDE